ncbi:MAG: efflux RND transporter periplasmic adaptor subunit [Gammaproteobacteria bacterium]|nr:efflux RND transporter periplasmic adaptor subunit [Gammaproteobacteria bacterium]
MFVRLLLVLALLAAIFGGIFGWKHYQQQQAAAQQQGPPPATVAVHTVGRSPWQPELNAIGTLVSANGIDVTAELAGVVRDIAFESGEAVEEGDVLLTQDDSVERAELEGLLAEQRLSRIRYRRVSRLVTDQSVSEADVDEAKAELDNTTAQVAVKRAQIAKKQVRAPFSGRLGIRLVDVGQFLEPGVAIVPLEDFDPIYVDFALPERHLGLVAVGRQVAVTAEALGGERFVGQISAINPGVDVATRTLRLRATVDNPEGRLRSGMFVQTAVLLEARPDVVTIPRGAVSYAPYGDSVFVVEEQDSQLTAERRQITTGAVRPKEVEVVEGLEAGERIVVAGHVKLRNGQAVEIDNEVMPGGEPLGK